MLKAFSFCFPFSPSLCRAMLANHGRHQFSDVLSQRFFLLWTRLRQIWAMRCWSASAVEAFWFLPQVWAKVFQCSFWAIQHPWLKSGDFSVWPLVVSVSICRVSKDGLHGVEHVQTRSSQAVAARSCRKILSWIAARLAWELGMTWSMEDCAEGLWWKCFSWSPLAWARVAIMSAQKEERKVECATNWN